MSGHSKWHNIQAKKGKADAARGKIFTKIGREIAIAPSRRRRASWAMWITSRSPTKAMPPAAWP